MCHLICIGVPVLSLIVICKHHKCICIGQTLAQPQGIAIPGSCQQVLLGICNSVWGWCLKMGWIPRWGSLWMAISSVSDPFFVPAFPLERNHSGLKILMGGWPLSSTVVLAYALDMVSTGSVPPLLGISANVITLGSWGTLAFLASGTFQWIQPVPGYTPRCYTPPFNFLTLSTSPLSPPTPNSPLPTHLPPSLYFPS